MHVTLATAYPVSVKGINVIDARRVSIWTELHNLGAIFARAVQLLVLLVMDMRIVRDALPAFMDSVVKANVQPVKIVPAKGIPVPVRMAALMATTKKQIIDVVSVR